MNYQISTRRPRTGRTTYHRDGSVTLWSCLQEQWIRSNRPDDDVLATLSHEECDRVVHHCAISPDPRNG